MSIASGLIEDFKHEASLSRGFMEIVPEDHFGWKPHEKSTTLGYLASHIADTPGWVHSILNDELDFASSASEWRPFVAETRSQLIEVFDDKAAEFASALAGRDDAFMMRMWTMRYREKVLMQMPRGAAIRSIVLHHIVHHRGQLSVFLRLLDVPVPSTYGPTADHPAVF